MTNGKGGRPPEYEPADFIEAVKQGELVGTQDVADELGCSYENAYKWLHRLEESGEVGKRKVANTIIWTVNDQ